MTVILFVNHFHIHIIILTKDPCLTCMYSSSSLQPACWNLKRFSISAVHPLARLMDFGVELLSVVKTMVVMLEILQNAQVITFLLNRVTSYNKKCFIMGLTCHMLSIWKDAHQPVNSSASFVFILIYVLFFLHYYCMLHFFYYHSVPSCFSCLFCVCQSLYYTAL